MSLRRRAAVLAIATSAAVVVTTGTASAYWSTAGAGSGTASTGRASWLTVDPGLPSTALAPGGVADVTVAITNPTAAPVLVTSVTTPVGGVPGFLDAGLLRPAAACDAAHSGVYVLSAATRPTSFVIAAHGTYSLTISKAITMSVKSDNACQGVFFATGVTVEARSAAGATPAVPAAGTL